MPKISEVTNQMNPVAWLEQELDKYDQTTVRPPKKRDYFCLLYTSPSPRDQRGSRMPSSA